MIDMEHPKTDGCAYTATLTKREHFAAMAMQGLLANPNPGPIAMCAQMAVESADALIEELNKTSK